MYSNTCAISQFYYSTEVDIEMGNSLSKHVKCGTCQYMYMYSEYDTEHVEVMYM